MFRSYKVAGGRENWIVMCLKGKRLPVFIAKDLYTVHITMSHLQFFFQGEIEREILLFVEIFALQYLKVKFFFLCDIDSSCQSRFSIIT